MKLFIIFIYLIMLLISCTSLFQNESMINEENKKNGEQLFKQHCSQCHHESMCIEKTGPALNKSIAKRNISWIRQYIIKGSEQSKIDGDTIALQLEKKGWGLMPSFNFLSKNELDALILYINTVVEKK